MQFLESKIIWRELVRRMLSRRHVSVSVLFPLIALPCFEAPFLKYGEYQQLLKGINKKCFDFLLKIYIGSVFHCVGN